MTKARDLANFVSTGSPLADGTIAVADISDLTASATELNILDGDGTSGWKVAVSGTDLLFKYNGTAKLKIESDGDVTAVGDVTAFGTL